MSDAEEAMEAVSQARHQVDRYLAPIKVDSYDAPYRDSLILTAHILDTHKSRLEGLERAATLLAPLRASLFAVSSNVSDVWGPDTAAELEALLPPRPSANLQVKGAHKNAKQQASLTVAPSSEADTAPQQLLPPHFNSWLKVAPDPQFAAIAQQQQAAFIERQRKRTRAAAAALVTAEAAMAAVAADDTTATAVDAAVAAEALTSASSARWARIRTAVWDAAATSPAVGLGFGGRTVAIRDTLQAQFYPPPPAPPDEPELENAPPEGAGLESAATPEAAGSEIDVLGGEKNNATSGEAAIGSGGGEKSSSSAESDGNASSSSSKDPSSLNLANRVAQLELLANRHHYQLTTELPQLRQEVGHLRQASAQLQGRVRKLERENQKLKDWVAAYPAMYEAQIRKTVQEEPWFLETVEAYARDTIEASGLPTRMQTQEQASKQVGPRLARTEARSVDAAISQVLGMMLRAGYLRPGRSTHDPDLQFEAKIVSPAAALEATQAEIDADPANALEPPSLEENEEATTTTEGAAATPKEEAAATATPDGVPASEEDEPPAHHPAAFAASTKVTFSTPVNLREIEASVSSVRDDMDTCAAAVEDCDAKVKTCVTHEELDRALDLESEEALADPQGNPLLRMKANLEASLAAAVAAADARTAQQLVTSAATAKKELTEVNDRISTALAAQSRALQATNDRTSCGEEKQNEFNAKIEALTATMNNLPDPAPQIEALNAQGFDLLAANGKLAAQLATAVSESDKIRTSLSHLTHELKHAGYCKAADLMDAEDRLKKSIDTCLDNIGVLGDATDDMRSLVKRGATMAQVAAFVEKAIGDAAAKLLPPDDTAMATTMRCLGCNQPYLNMHGSKADWVAHSSLPGLPEGPSSTTPETRKVYRDQWGVLLATYEHTNAEMEKRRKAHASSSQQSGSGGSLVLPAATGRNGQPAPQQGGGDSSVNSSSNSRSTTRGGGLKPLGQVHVPHVPVHSGHNKLPLTATPQQLSANHNHHQQQQQQQQQRQERASAVAAATASAAASGGQRASSAAQRAELDDRSRQREAEAAQQYLTGEPIPVAMDDPTAGAAASSSSPLDPFFPKRRSSKEGPEPAPPNKIFDVSVMSEAEATAMPSDSLTSSKGAPL